MLNVPLLVGTLIAAVVLGPAAYLWHSYWLTHVAGAMLDRADALEKEEDWAAAAGYFHRYLQFHPDDVDARVRLAKTYDRSAGSLSRAIDLYYLALGVAPVDQQAELRLRLTELLVRGQRFASAEKEAEKLQGCLLEELLPVRLSNATLGNRQKEIKSLLAIFPDDDLKKLLANPPTEEIESIKRRLTASSLPADQWRQDTKKLLARLPVDFPSECETRLKAKDKGRDFQEWLESWQKAKRFMASAFYGQAQSGALVANPKGGASVGKAVEEALELNPADIGLAAILAHIYRDREELLSAETRGLSDTQREQLADKVIDQMVSANQEDLDRQDPDQEDPDQEGLAVAYVARYEYRVRYKLSQAEEKLKAEEDLNKALELGPENLIVVLTAANHARREAILAQQALDAQQEGASEDEIAKHWDEARTWYENATKLAPADERACLGLGQVYLVQGETDLAIKEWRRGLKKGNKESILLSARLAEVLIAAGRLDEAWIRTNNPEESAKAEKTPLYTLGLAVRNLAPRLRRTQRASLEGLRDLIQARWLVKKGHHVQDGRPVNGYLEAIPRLRRLTVGQRSEGPEVTQAVQAWMLLGGAYAALAQWDQAATAYEEALRLQPEVPRPRLAAAGAWATAGRPDVATRHYEQALPLEDTASTWYLLARVQFRRQMNRPKAERDWKRFDRALAQAKDPNRQERLKNAWRLKLIEADYAVVRAEERGERDQGIRDATKLLREAENEYSDSPDLLRRLVLAYEQLECPADADRVLEELDKLAGDSADAYVLRSRLYSRRKQYDEARKVLEAGFAAFPKKNKDDPPPKEHAPLRYGLVQLSLDQNDSEQAQLELRELHKNDPANMGLIRQLTELAFQAGNIKDLESWEKELRKVEGPNGSWWRYYRARRLLAQAKDVNDRGFIEAGELYAQIQGQRPSWPRAHLLGGLIWQRRGNYERAAEAYQEAIRLGDQRISVYGRLIALLYGTGQYAEADQYLARLQEHVPASQSLSSLEISAAARLGELDRAVEAARRGVTHRPKDPMARVWLGQMLLANKQEKEAETAFQEAVKVAPGDVRVYSGLFSFYLRTDRPDRAKEALQALIKNVKLEKAQQAFVLAQGYELLAQRKEGDERTEGLKEAGAKYREAQRLAPESVGVQRRFAAFLLRTDAVAAEREIRRLLELAPESGPARRTLAAILAARGGEKEWQEAQQLLEQSGADDASNLDRRLQALLLAQRPGEDNRRKARQILEGLIADSRNPVAGDRLLLARLYEAEGKLQATRQQYIALVGRADPNKSHLALYIDFLLRQNDKAKREIDDDKKALDEEADAGAKDKLKDEVTKKERALATAQRNADTWLRRLEDMAPDDLGTVSVRTRWLHLQGETKKIEPLVEQLAEKRLKALQKDEQIEAKTESALCLVVGNVYSAVEQHQAAERWYRRVVQLVPEAYGPLAMSLARQDRMAEAIRICLDAAKSDNTPRPAMTLASVLTSGEPTKADFQLADPLLKKAGQDHKDNATLLSSLAGVRIAEQQLEDAVQLYQQVLKLRPKDVLALNNLATLLAEDPDRRDDALQYIDEAIQIAGPQAPLLDTKGTIFVYDGRPGQAVQWLETAAAVANPDPRYHFHLAVAYDQLGQIEKARSAFSAARTGELTRQILMETDRKYLQELEGKYGKKRP